MATPELNPPSQNAHGPELSPLGTRPQDEVDNTLAGDAAWVAQQAQAATSDTRTGVPYDSMNHGGQPGTHTKPGYDDYKHQGRQA